VEGLTYLAIILAWALPLIAVEWAFGWHLLLEELRPLAITVGMATVYLGCADIAAVRNGIWALDPAKTLPLRGGGFVFEDWVLLLLTNVIIAQAVVLGLDDDIRARVAHVLRRLWP
jgi:putative membrane protein